MVRNFAAEITEYAKQGAPNVTEAEYAERVQNCDACPHLERDDMRCGLCGCYVEHKAKCSDIPYLRFNSNVGERDSQLKPSPILRPVPLYFERFIL